MAKAKHIHIHLRPRQTKDAGFDESKVKRDEGGKFSAQQHADQAAYHASQAGKHEDPTVAKAHFDAAKAHQLAEQHIHADTGWQEHNSQKAHNATKAAQAAEQQAGGPANAEQLKAVAADPKQPLSARADAVKQLEGMQKQADMVAGSPLAVPQPAAPQPAQGLNISPELKARLAAIAPKIKAQQEPKAFGDVVPGQKMPAKAAPPTGATALQKFPVGSKVRLGSSAEEHEVVGHGGAGSNAILKLKSGGIMPAQKAKLIAVLASTHPSKNVGPTQGSKLGPDMPGHKIPPKPNNPLTDRPTAKGGEPSDGQMKAHPQYTKEDHEYLKGKGWSNSEIAARWDAEKSHGDGPAKGKPPVPDYVGVISNPNFYKNKK